MIKIAHRGNLYGKDPTRENKPEYILKAISKGFDVEVDVWYEDQSWYLGHDEPIYKIGKDFLVSEMLWCHAKNKQALYQMSKLKDVHYFWHQEDNYTIPFEVIV